MLVKAAVNIGDIDWSALRAFGELDSLPPCEGDVCDVPDLVGARLVARGWAVEVVQEPEPEKPAEPVKAKLVAASGKQYAKSKEEN